MSREDRTVLIGATVFDGDAFLERHAVVIERGRIAAVIPEDTVRRDLETVELQGGVLAPGFVDLQVNGGGGVLFNNEPTADAIRIIATAHRAMGSTSIVPTVISDSKQVRACAVAAARQQADRPRQVPAVHLEGPFLNRRRRGAHAEQFVRVMEAEDVAWIADQGDLKVILTLAPEAVSPEHIERLAKAGVFVCAGHSEASYSETMKAIDAGVRGFTHLFNAMPPVLAREPGIVGAALDADESWCGIVADGHHVHVSAIRTAWKAKPSGKLFLVSDSMATTGSSQRSFDLYGETLREQGGQIVNREGRLAGSAIGLIDAVKTTRLHADIPMTEVLRMASLYPAEFLGLEGELGRLRKGHIANLVHFDDEFVVHNTWVGGARADHRNGTG